MDPDFGWHLRLGEIISHKGIPYHDPLSYTMSNFAFVDHEWLSNVLIYRIYKLFNIFGLSVIFSLIATSAIFVLSPRTLNLWLVPFLFLISVTLLKFFGIRTQVETWLFSAIFIRILYSPRLWLRYKFFLPLIFLIWANLHGGFALGIGLLFIKLITLIWNRSKIQLSDILVISLSILATLINPYGLRLWGEIWTQLTDFHLRQTIVEWKPVYSNFSIEEWLTLVLYLYISGLLLVLFRKEFSLIQFLIYAILLVAAISSKRHIPIWILSSWPLFAVSIMKLKKDIDQFKRYVRHKLNLKILSSTFFITIFTIGLFQARTIFISAYNASEEFSLPKYSLKLLNNTNIKGEVFSNYGWGGYLDWKIPARKVFIDGRMPSWKWQSPDKRYSDSAMYEYEKIVDGSCSFKDIFEKYNITTVIWSTELFSSDSGLISIGSWEDNIPTLNPFLRCLIKMGWKKVYDDQITRIYNKD